MPFGGAAKVMPLLWMFIGLSAAEVPILHLILPWHTARVITLGLGAYGLLWMVGILASLKVHPHLVGPTGMRIRSGLSYDVTVPWNAVATAQPVTAASCVATSASSSPDRRMRVTAGAPPRAASAARTPSWPAVSVSR